MPVRVRPLAESINVLAGTKGLPLDAAYSAWADSVEAERKAAAKAAKKAAKKSDKKEGDKPADESDKTEESTK